MLGKLSQGLKVDLCAKHNIDALKNSAVKIIFLWQEGSWVKALEGSGIHRELYGEEEQMAVVF